jgi:endonuclease G
LQGFARFFKKPCNLCEKYAQYRASIQNKVLFCRNEGAYQVRRNIKTLDFRLKTVYYLVNTIRKERLFTFICKKMARKTRKTSYARRTRTRRAKSSWKLPKFSFAQIFYGLTFVGGLSGLSWVSSCNKVVDKVQDKIEKRVNDNQNNRDDRNDKNDRNDRASFDEDSPELPEIGQKDRSNVVKHKYYTLLYNEKHEQATWVAYQLDKKSVNGETKRADDFRPDPDVRTGSATPEDYRNSGYDRGHLAPAGDFKLNATAMSETFFMSNMSPQLHEFNAGIWESLESKIRSWVQKRNKVYVVTGPILENGLPTIGQQNKVSVPKEYFKVVYDPAKKEMIGFIIPNRRSAKQLAAWAIKVDEIEKRTGLNFFPTLPDGLEEELESKVVQNDWFFEKKPKR